MKLMAQLLIVTSFLSINKYIFSMFPQTPPQTINSPTAQEKSTITSKIMTSLSIGYKVKKCIVKKYLIPNESSLDEIVGEVVRMLPEETFPDIFLEQQEGSTPIEQQILQLAKENKLKTVTLAKDIDIRQVIVSSSSSSSSSTPTLNNTPTNSPVGSPSDTELFDMEK